MKFATLFRYRNQCMALAILLVMISHTKWMLPDGALKTLASYAYGGVDLFFFVSGVGCFFSWQRDRDPAAFLLRRAKRILPVYLPFILVWLALMSREQLVGPRAALANLLGVEGFVKVEPSFNWYVSGMWLSYLLTPWLAALAERCGTKLRAAAATAALVLLSVAFWHDHEWIIIMTRLPIFFAGMLFAAESGRRERLTRGEIALALALIPIGGLLLWEFSKYWPDQLWDCGLHWYPFLLIVPGACVTVALFASLLERHAAGRILNRAVAFLGGMTFEIYLTHLAPAEAGMSLLHVLLLTVVGTALLWGLSRLIRGALERRAAGSAS